MKEKNMKNQTGITLIALIITIIIMLILIAVTVSVLINSNIIGATQRTSKKMRDYIANESNLSIEDFINIDSITARTIKNAPTEYYGKTVTGLTLNNGDTDTEWKIFYADDENIYLIAGDKIDVTQYAPIYSNEHSRGSDDFCYIFDEVVEDDVYIYSEGAENEAIFGEGTVGRKLLSTYLQYLENNSSLSKTNGNMKATAFMLDTEAWKIYTDSDQENSYIEYAIGGPTIEMFATSFNEYFKNEGRTIITGVDEYGYKVGGTYGNNSVALNDEFNINDLVATDEPLYFLDTGDMTYWWLASPSCYDDVSLCEVDIGNYNSTTR